RFGFSSNGLDTNFKTGLNNGVRTKEYKFGEITLDFRYLLNYKIITCSIYTHIPFYTLQAHIDGIRWCHIVGKDVVWFKRFETIQNYNKNSNILFLSQILFYLFYSSLN
ncbi:unnamed protein product, partial [marine sediment metagenome]